MYILYGCKPVAQVGNYEKKKKNLQSSIILLDILCNFLKLRQFFSDLLPFSRIILLY
jgi:hypothetical protein